MKRHLTSDMTAAAIVLTALVALVVWILPGYLERSEMKPVPINTGVEKVNDESRGMTDFPCPLTQEGC